MTLISIIIPFHDNLARLRQSVSSVCKQSLGYASVHLEILVGNDSDISRSSLRSSLQSLVPFHITLLVINNKYKRGPGGNRNSAIEASSGTLIAFLDADDTWEPMKLLAQYHLFLQGRNFISTAFSYAEDSVIVSPPRSLLGYKSIFYSLRPLGCSTVMVSRCLLPSKPFHNLWFCQDLILWSTLLKDPKCNYGSVDLPLVNYTRNGGRTSKALFLTHLSYYYTAARISGLNHYESIFALALYTSRAALNKIIRPLLVKLTSTQTF
jgi:glycosyltransferase involved in cell wall biosynthesis